MRASEDAPTDPDEQHPLSGKELQGLGGGMAPNQIGGSQASAAQAGGNDDKRWNTPRQGTYDREYNSDLDPAALALKPAQVADEATKQTRAAITGASISAAYPSTAGQSQSLLPKGWPYNGQKPNSWTERNNSNNMFPPAPAQEKHFEGSAGYGRNFPQGEDPADAHAELQWKWHPEADKAEEKRKLRDRKISPNGNGEEQEPNLDDGDDEKQPKFFPLP